jgi:hypothetical protein
MSRKSPAHATPELIGGLILMAILLPTVLAGQYGASGPGPGVSFASAAGPDVCLSPNWPRPPVPLYAPGVGVQPRLLAYPVTWPVPRGPFGTRATLRYPAVPIPAVMISPYRVTPQPFGLPPAVLIGNSLVSGPVYARLPDCRAR